MSQAELARRTKIRPATINEYCHELVKRVNIAYLSRICDVLKCEVSELLEFVPDKKEDTKGGYRK